MPDINNFVGKEIPQEVLDQLKIANRVRHYLKPSHVSAVSSRGDVSPADDNKTPSGLPAEKQAEKELDEIIDDVAELEGLIEQLEDLADQHLANMKIPAANDNISNAAKTLGSEDGSIDKNVLDNALAIMDYYPLLSMGQDPVLAALIGNGNLNGKWLKCNEITPNVAELFELDDREEYDPDQVVEQQYNNVKEQHDKSLAEMILEILLMLWWNMLWPKTVVDMTIINPIKMGIAYPTDAILLFFFKLKSGENKELKISWGKKKRFKTANKNQISGNGPITKVLNRLRLILLCEIPPKLYPRYKPMVNIDCTNIQDCEPEAQAEEVSPETESIEEIGPMMDAAGSQKCVNTEDLLTNADKTYPTNLGASPDCIDSAVTVINAVVADALTPPRN